jgi:transcriptional regulator with XRE-family HTH domain
MSELDNQLKEEFADPDYRAAYAESFVDAWIALQIRIIREQRGMTQKDLAEALHTTQTAISRLENVNYSGRTIGTLKNVAKAFDCRLKVSFETYGSLIGEAEKFSPEYLRRPNFKDESDGLSAPLANLPAEVWDNSEPVKRPYSGITDLVSDNRSLSKVVDIRSRRGPLGEMDEQAARKTGTR